MFLTKAAHPSQIGSGTKDDNRIKPPPGVSGPWSLLLVAALLTAIAWLLALQVPALDAFFFAQARPALNEMGVSPPNPALVSGLIQAIMQLTGLLGVAFAAIAFSKKLPPDGVVVVAIQIFVLTSIIQLAAFAFLGYTPLLATYLLTCAGATFTGFKLRSRDKEKKLIESQFYELVMRNRELEEARLALVKQDEVERRLLAADLHDQVLNDLKKIVETFKKYSSEPTDSLKAQIEGGFQKTMIEIREIMDDLCPVMLQNFGLGPALEDCLDKGSERSGFDKEFESTLEEEEIERFSQVEQSLIYRLVQESITNICKHAQAENVSVELTRKGRDMLIFINDDGKGIDYGAISHQSRGLRYMRLRADLIEGTIEWKEGKNGKGTTVVIRVPFPYEKAPPS
ncbi:MAG: hypothetical protein K2Z81_07585 [Cyanobacteria bacterium]|nr:hypothetical protein [Cyanobacteriota bacterium]